MYTAHVSDPDQYGVPPAGYTLLDAVEGWLRLNHPDVTLQQYVQSGREGTLAPDMLAPFTALSIAMGWR